MIHYKNIGRLNYGVTRCDILPLEFPPLLTSEREVEDKKKKSDLSCF